MDIAMAFENAGAHLTTTNSVKPRQALGGARRPIRRHPRSFLSDGDSSSLCARLAERDVPYLIYSGFKTIDGPCQDAPHLSKPATHQQLLDAVEALMRDHKL
jgi:hypothetical protein